MRLASNIVNLKFYYGVDWVLFFSILPLLGVGLLTMHSFIGESNFFDRQVLWIVISLSVFFIFSFIDWRFLKRTDVLVFLFVIASLVLSFLLFAGPVARGAQSWFQFGGFSFQPSDPVKILVILMLAKYFSRRHIEIAHIRHILISGFYAFVPFLLVFLQPDFGSALIILLIWLGMIIVSGVSKKHLLLFLLIGAIGFAFLWTSVFEEYQRQRIVTFLYPFADVGGAGYNAYQSTIAVGSGELFGRGVGYGTQSRLKFLPEYQTDFIFAAFAEEWGFVGVLILFVLFGIVIWRILYNSMLGAGNFETLFGMGLAILFMSHFVIHIGTNIGLLPVTGTTLPFISYGGSHLLTEFAGLGILMGMRRYRRIVHKDDMKHEFVGV